MSVKIRQIELTCNPCLDIRLDALERALPQAAIDEALAETNTKTPRERKLNLAVTMWLVIAINLFTGDNIGYVLERLCRGLRTLLFLGAETSGESAPESKLSIPAKIPGDSALVYRRYQLGVKPVVALFHNICKPMADESTQGAFLFGLRLMGIDGQIMTVADTPENAAHFGRMSGKGISAYVKVKGVYLCELATHAIIDAGFWPCHISEETAAYRLLRSVKKGMLVLFDQGLWAAERVIAVRKCGAHVLCRLPSTVKPVVERPLSDGSHLVWVSPSSSRKASQANAKGKDRERIQVRLIEYTIDDPAMPGCGEKYRIITSLADPDLYPARELAVAYHERWEIEIAFDELEAHQLRLPCAPLRSKKPVGVLQELYGLLIAHWVVRSFMHQAAQEAEADPDRLSFTRALRVIRDVLNDFQMLDPSCWPRLHRWMLLRIAERLLPTRAARSNPRVVKCRQSKFPVKREKHKDLPPLPKTFAQAIVLR
jgi:Insertion element 4 transposase N-terminal/Transposase DDE domain